MYKNNTFVAIFNTIENTFQVAKSTELPQWLYIYLLIWFLISIQYLTNRKQGPLATPSNIYYNTVIVVLN